MPGCVIQLQMFPNPLFIILRQLNHTSEGTRSEADRALAVGGKSPGEASAAFSQSQQPRSRGVFDLGERFKTALFGGARGEAGADPRGPNVRLRRAPLTFQVLGHEFWAGPWRHERLSPQEEAISGIRNTTKIKWNENLTPTLHHSLPFSSYTPPPSSPGLRPPSRPRPA